MTGIEFTIAAGITIAGTTVVSTATLVGIGLSLALSALSSMLFRPSLPSFRGPSQMIKAPTSPRQTVYGEIKTSGVVTFIHVRTGDTKRLLIAVAVASHKVQSFQLLTKGMWIADEVVFFHNENPTADLGRGDEATTSPFDDHAWINVALGTTTQTPFWNLLNRAQGKWTSTHQQKGVAGFAMELHFNRKIYPTNIPNLAVYLKGHAEIYDPRDLSTGYKNNAALIIRHYLLTPKSAGGFGACPVIAAGSFVTGQRYIIKTVGTTSFTAIGAASNTVGVVFTATGAGSGTGDAFSTEEINEASFTSAANTSDEDVTLKSVVAAGSFVVGNIYVIKTVGTTSFTAIGASANTVGIKFTATGVGSGSGDAYNTEKRYTINMQYTWDIPPATILQGMLSACAGKLYNINGQWTLYVGAAITPTWTLTEADVIGPVDILGRAAREERFNAVKGTYMSPTNSWEESDFVPVVNATYKTEDNNELIYHDVKFPATTSDTTAQRLAKIILEDHRQSLTIKTRCTIAALQTMGGDWINVTLPRYGWSAKVFEVLEHTPAIEDGFLFFDLVLKETASTIYTWSHLTDETTVDLAPNTNLGNPFDVNVPANVVLTADSSVYLRKQDGRIEARILIEWETDDGMVEGGGSFQIQWKPASVGDWTQAHTVTIQAEDGQTAYATYLSPITAGVEWDVRIRARNIYGGDSDWAEDSITPAYDIVYDDIPPVVTTPIPIVVNPSFESGTYGWRRSLGGGGGAAAATLSYGRGAVSNPIQFGSYNFGYNHGSLDITNMGTGPTATEMYVYSVNETQGAAESKSFAVSPSTAYTFSVKAGKDDLNHPRTISFKVSQWQSNGTFISTTSIGSVSTTSGTPISPTQLWGSFTTAANCAYVSLLIIYNGIGFMIFDGVDIRLGTLSSAPVFGEGLAPEPLDLITARSNQELRVSSTLGSGVTVAEGTGWTYVTSLQLPMSSVQSEEYATGAKVQLSSLMTAVVDINTAGSLTLEWRLLRNGTEIRKSQALAFSADETYYLPPVLHVDPDFNGYEGLVEYQLEARKTTLTGASHVVTISTAGVLSAQVKGI